MRMIDYAKRISGVFALLIFVTACEFEDSDFEKQKKADDEQIKNYLSKNGLTATRDESGIYYEVLKENPSGNAVSTGNVISIFFEMKTLAGELVGKNTDSVAPVRFMHDYKSIIPLGLDYAVHLMKEDEKYRFYIPSVLAYDSYYSDGDFAPNTNFIVDVEVAAIEDETDIYDQEMDSIHRYIAANQLDGVASFSSGLFYKQLEAGEGTRTPSDYSTVKFHFKRSYLDSTLIEATEANSPVVIPLGGGYAVNGLERGLKQMKKGEKSLLIMPSKIAFGSSIQILPLFMREKMIEDKMLQTKVQPFSPVTYEVELIDFY